MIQYQKTSFFLMWKFISIKKKIIIKHLILDHIIISLHVEKGTVCVYFSRNEIKIDEK